MQCAILYVKIFKIIKCIFKSSDNSNFETANDIGKCFPFKESLPKHKQSHVFIIWNVKIVMPIILVKHRDK